MCMPKTATPSLLKKTSFIDVGKRGPLHRRDTPTSSFPSKQIQVDSSSVSTSSQSRTGLLLNKYGLYNIRKNLQKMEFFVCWLVVLTMIGTNMSTELPVIWLKVSVFTRAFAYAVDFTNAYVKLNGSIPMWLVFHHFGVLAQHALKAFVLVPTSQYQVLVVAVGNQSTHNTWTKKLSLVLYWGNVLVGVFASSNVHLSHEESPTASLFCWSLLIICVGISLLVKDTISKSKMA